MAHREGIREYLKNVQVHGLVYDWGCGTKPIKNKLLPNEAKIIGIDQLDHVGADIVKNIEACCIELGELADFAFCLEVLEHTWESNMVISNIYDNLKEGGVLYLSQPFMYEVHKEDDRIRYTYNGLRQLLEEAGFTVEDIKPTQNVNNPTEEEMNKAWGYVVRAKK